MITTSLESRYAELILKLLLSSSSDEDLGADGWSRVQWPILLQLAQKNLTLVRTCNQLEYRGVVPDHAFQEAVAREKDRIGKTVELIGKVTGICRRAGIKFLFAKAFQHYPDMGHDVDLFVLDRSRNIDSLIKKEFRAVPATSSFVNRIAGKTDFRLDGYPSPIEVHHGRMGHFGEHNTYPEIVIENREEVVVGGVSTFIPSPEHQLIIQVLQRIYDHMYIRVSDIIHSVNIVRKDGLTWDYVVNVAKRIGVFDGLCCYLSCVDQIHNSLFEEHLLPEFQRKMVSSHRCGDVRFRGWYYRFPFVSVLSRVYAEKFFADMVSLNWSGMWRLCLIPIVALMVGYQRLTPFRGRLEACNCI